MDYQILVKDFAIRTRKNLHLLREMQEANPDLEIYEVTQLVNSLLGLLVFPHQSFVADIPKTPMAELQKLGWPIPRIIGEHPQIRDLNQLVRYLRNAIAHFNIRFLTDENLELSGIQVWNIRESYQKGGKKRRTTTWKAELSLQEIEVITEKFIDLVLAEAGYRLAGADLRFNWICPA